MAYALAAVCTLIIAAAAAWMVWLSFKDARTRDRTWEKKEMAWATERAELLNRVMFLADRPWETPPSRDEVSTPEPISYDPLLTPIPDDSFDYHANPAGVV